MTVSLPLGHKARAAESNDAAALADLMNRHSLALRGRLFTTAERQTALLTMPGLSPDSDTRVIVDPHGQLIGYGLVLPAPAFGARRQTYLVVDPDHAEEGIDAVLLEWIHERALSPSEARGDSSRIEVEQQVDRRDIRLQQRLESFGYQCIRIFHRMEISLEKGQPPPVWPAGITVRSIHPEEDLEAALDAFEEIFADHWGHVRIPQEEAMKRLHHRFATHPDLDPSLWFLAMERDDIAAICFAFPRDGDEATTGYVETLGVRRPWRGQGLALALLRKAFSVLRDQGSSKAFLYVDSESLTGATRLYEKAGMHVAERELLYSKMLRPGSATRAAGQQNG